MKNLKAKIVVILMFFSASSFAGGSGIVFDPTNFTQNIITAAQSVSAEGQRAAQLAQQARQTLAQYQQLTTLNGAAQSANLAQFQTQYQNAQNYSSSLTKLYGSVSNVKDALSQRFDEQKLSGLNSKDFAKAESDRIARGNAEAIDRATRNKQLLENVNKDYDQVRGWQDQIGGTVGTVDSMQLMNTQMNKMVAQNNQLIQSMAEKAVSDEYSKTEAYAKKNASNDAEQQMLKIQQDQAQKTKTDIDALDSKSKTK